MKTKKQKKKEQEKEELKSLIFRDKIFDIFYPGMRDFIKNPNDLEKSISYYFSYYIENKEQKFVQFTLRDNSEVNFEKLYGLATLLGTKKINFDEERIQWAYSEYTRGTDIFKRFYCYDVIFPL